MKWVGKARRNPMRTVVGGLAAMVFLGGIAVAAFLALGDPGRGTRIDVYPNARKSAILAEGVCIK